MRFLLLGTACAWLLTCSPVAAQLGVYGNGHARDGDSLTVGDKEVRLFGIDAPELDQTCQRDGRTWPCGAEAANRLSLLVTGKAVACDQVGTDQYQRMVARCRVGGADVNKTMVALGLAVAYRRYSSSEYVSTEEMARANKLGIWAGQFEQPSDYRHVRETTAQTRRTARRVAPKTSSSGWAGRARANCNIKGNRNRRGHWIYHLPGMPYYEQTRPEEIFCSEAEAEAAGYRRAIVR